MKSLNKVQLIGNLGKDPEVGYTQNGIAYVKYSIATTRTYKKGDEFVEETDWHSAVHWRGEKVAEFLKKGSRVYFEGRLQTRSYEDREGVKRWTTEIVVEEVILLTPAATRGNSQAEPRHETRPASKPEPAYDGPVSDDDVPF